MGINSRARCQYSCADSRTKWLLGALRAHQSPQMTLLRATPICSRGLCLLRDLQHVQSFARVWCGAHQLCKHSSLHFQISENMFSTKGMNYMLANLQMNRFYYKDESHQSWKTPSRDVKIMTCRYKERNETILYLMSLEWPESGKKIL